MIREQMLSTEEANDLSMLVGTAYPVLAIAYYTAGRLQADAPLVTEGPLWRETITVPDVWGKHRVLRWTLELIGRNGIGVASPYSLPFDERFRLSSDRIFALSFPTGFLATLAFLVTSWRWTLAVGIVLVQIVLNCLIFFCTQTADISLVTRLRAVKAENLDADESERYYDLKARPFVVLTRLYALLTILLILAIGLAMAVLFG
jgi:hypothetical protein